MQLLVLTTPPLVAPTHRRQLEIQVYRLAPPSGNPNGILITPSTLTDSLAMPDPRDILDLSALASANTPPPARPASDASDARPFLRLWFDCAKQYARAYRSPDGTAYVGRCPTCGASTRFRVGTGGTSERFFRVSC